MYYLILYYYIMDCFVSTQKVPKKELRQLVITSFSNTINTKNEGNKHDSYNRVLLNRKKKAYTKQYDLCK